jgi:hypothetical protein
VPILSVVVAKICITTVVELSRSFMFDITHRRGGNRLPRVHRRISMCLYTNSGVHFVSAIAQPPENAATTTSELQEKGHTVTSGVPDRAVDCRLVIGEV